MSTFITMLGIVFIDTNTFTVIMLSSKADKGDTIDAVCNDGTLTHRLYYAFSLVDADNLLRYQ